MDDECPPRRRHREEEDVRAHKSTYNHRRTILRKTGLSLPLAASRSIRGAVVGEDLIITVDRVLHDYVRTYVRACVRVRSFVHCVSHQ